MIFCRLLHVVLFLFFPNYSSLSPSIIVQDHHANSLWTHMSTRRWSLVNFIKDTQYGTLCGTTHMVLWRELVDSWAKFRWNKLGQCLSLMDVTRLLVIIYPSFWNIANSWIARIDMRKRNKHLFCSTKRNKCQSWSSWTMQLCKTPPTKFVGGVWHLTRHELWTRFYFLVLNFQVGMTNDFYKV